MWSLPACSVRSCKIDLLIAVDYNRKLEDTQGFPGVVVTSCWFERSVAVEKIVSCADHFLFAPMRSFPIEGKR